MTHLTLTTSPFRKPEPKPAPTKPTEPAKPQKTWGAAGSKKAEPPTKAAEPEKKPGFTLKKAEPGNKKPETQKAEMPSLKPTPKQQKGLKDEAAKESVQLKSTLKHEVCHFY